jgi:sulfur carrier protein ThiS
MRLHLGGYLSFYAPNRKSNLEVEVEGQIPLKEVLKQNSLPAGDVFLVVLNGILVDLQDARVTNSDRVELYPPDGGG